MVWAPSMIMHGHHINNAILIRSSEFPAPVLLKLDIAANGSGKAERITSAIQKFTREYGLDLQSICMWMV